MWDLGHLWSWCVRANLFLHVLTGMHQALANAMKSQIDYNSSLLEAVKALTTRMDALEFLVKAQMNQEEPNGQTTETGKIPGEDV